MAWSLMPPTHSEWPMGACTRGSHSTLRQHGVATGQSPHREAPTLSALVAPRLTCGGFVESLPCREQPLRGTPTFLSSSDNTVLRSRGRWGCQGRLGPTSSLMKWVCRGLEICWVWFSQLAGSALDGLPPTHKWGADPQTPLCGVCLGKKGALGPQSPGTQPGEQRNPCCGALGPTAQEHRASHPGSTSHGCVTLGRLLSLSVPVFCSKCKCPRKH